MVTILLNLLDLQFQNTLKFNNNNKNLKNRYSEISPRLTSLSLILKLTIWKSTVMKSKFNTSECLYYFNCS